jgi:ferredoxin-type protein NapH
MGKGGDMIDALKKKGSGKTLPLRQRIRRACALVSMLLFPITFYYFSPAVTAMGASEGVVTGSLLVFAALFLSSLVVGRVFCSWVCPAGACQDFAARSNDKPVVAKAVGFIKYFIWLPWLGLIAFFFIRAGGILRIDPLYMTDHGVSVSNLGAYIVYYLVLAVFVLPAFFGRKRLACRSICWMAPFMILGTKLKDALSLPSLSLRAEPSACSACKGCDARCPMGLPVSELVAKNDMRHSECILCGECVDGCPSKAISFSWKSQRRSTAKG